MTNAQGKLDIAVVGATGLVGRVILDMLAARKLPIGQVFPLASDDSEGKSAEFGQHHLSVHCLNEFDFRQVQLALFCVPPDVALQVVPEAVAAGAIVIDLSSAYRLAADVPLVVAEVNSTAIADYARQQIIACPDSAAIQLALCLYPLHRQNPLERINATLMYAVSDIGRAGIDELSGQSIALFNLKDRKPKHFSQQIAFNVLGHAGVGKEKQGALRERHLQQELQKILEDPDIGVNVTATQVPVFFGCSAALHIEFKDEISTEQAQKLLELQSRISLATDTTVVSHAANSDHVFVSRVRKDPTWDRGLNLWTVMDNVRSAAINCVHIAEILVKDYL